MEWNLEDVLSYYRIQGAPGDQNALIGLLGEIQQHHGGIPAHMLGIIAGSYGIPESLLQALIRRIPRLRLKDTHCLELCAGANCGRHTALAELAESLRGGRITVKYVPCMRQCGKGPNIRWDGKLYHRADAGLLRELIGKEQNDRSAAGRMSKNTADR